MEPSSEVENLVNLGDCLIDSIAIGEEPGHVESASHAPRTNQSVCNAIRGLKACGRR
jgi:hypothetical protein